LTLAFLTGTIQFKAYIDSAETEFPQELVSDIKKEFENDAITEVQSTTISLAAGGSQSITLNGVSPVKRWYLYSSSTALTIDVNGLGNMTFQAGEPGYIPITLTSLSITNASGTTATTVTLILIAS
jgi:hypothetical protein